MGSRKVGVSTNTILKPITIKQREDEKRRLQSRRKKAQKAKKRTEKMYGSLIYQCSNCTNTIRVKDEMTDEKILCTKCNEGFFTVLLDQKTITK